ncbi:uncharacterized protein LOC126844131 isoform X1 [Adelges cooleyi]|uniref:uncharacterized protein LOC126844131 isoform X1 n=1 Tax=Adelges cooleyi TaxID=133065 RepID=UPI0021806DDA|nr:uncharacterized protein LOC126844131 isoform X1 [Adelges cooleyi]
MMSAFIILLCIQIAMTVDLPKKKPIDPREIKWSAVGPLQADKINTHDPWLSKSLWHEDGRFNFTEKIYEIDRTDSFKRMHIQDDIMSYLPDSPYKEPGKQLSTNVEKTSNSGTKELSEVEYFKNPALCSYSRAICHDKSDVSTETSAEDIETDRWFNPVNANWQQKWIIKLKLPFKHFEPHDIIEKKKLNSYPIIKTIAGDGNCLFRSLSYWVTGSEVHHRKMRKLIVDFMKTNKRIKKYFNGPTKRDRYLSETMMAKGGQWGTENEVIATAMLLKTSIYVFATHLRKWILYNKDIENQNKPGEDEMCIYIRNLRELHYDVVIDIGNKEMYLH